MQLRWVGAWAAAPQLVEEHNLPPSPGLASNTLRQVVRTSIGGEKIRIRLSNEYGQSNLEIQALHIAIAEQGSQIRAGTDQPVTFAGKPSVIVPPGQSVISDAIDYSIPKLTTIALTIHFGAVPIEMTGHPGSRTTSYIMPGCAHTMLAMPDAVTTDHWYYITGIDIAAQDSETVAIAALGDSLTDGRGTTANGNDRWTDVLAERLQANQPTAKVGVLNMGLGGNAVLRGGLGPTLLSRFERDCLKLPGVRYAVILAGVNDIGVVQNEDDTAERLIEAYRFFVTKAHQHNIRVYGGTILPFGESWYYTPIREQIRQKVNNWIRTSNLFDAVIDFAAAVQDPENPHCLCKIYDSGDMLHLNPLGYRRMGEVIDLELFTK